ncbi:hypothetical protein P5673_033695 [Acropora cervicornis]|uniref:Uncharacterized protein n=1 Tax=Acropora cervicornis TaxID=6130 RepID=A0AAD9UR20_ACRCE|nr:hypothetical protein P5673_033695 [Acropora cervicornis]
MPVNPTASFVTPVTVNTALDLATLTATDIDTSGRSQISVQEGVERRGASIEDRTDSSGRLQVSFQEGAERTGAAIKDRTGERHVF